MENNLPIFKNVNALLVEDNPINRKMMKYTLKNIGISCDIAENGQIGFEMRKKREYDVIFMDIQMPVMNGVEATKAIINYEKKNNLNHIPIIAVTANALNGDREKFLSDGMDEYVPKPIDLNIFLNVLQKFFLTEEREDSSKNILIYKETKLEAKIIGAMVEKLGYEAKIVNDIDEFKIMIDESKYYGILLDRVKSNDMHTNITLKIEPKNIPSLLFIDNNISISPRDKNTYTHITYKLTNFQQIQEKLSSMME
jgi:CheY-like chemotaxis protein